MVTYSSFLAWRIPGIEEPGGLQPWGPKASDMTEGLTFSLFPRKLRESDPFVILDSYVSKTVMEFLYNCSIQNCSHYSVFFIYNLSHSLLLISSTAFRIFGKIPHLPFSLA